MSRTISMNSSGNHRSKMSRPLTYRWRPKSFGSVPLTLVKMAKAAKDDPRNDFDEYWCVFDVEWPINHPNLAEALDLAHGNGIQVAVTNPCFELWLILHFQNQRAWIDNDAARRLRRRLDGATDKGVDASAYMPNRHTAKARAVELDKLHSGNDTAFPQNNPSSGMHRFLASVESHTDGADR